MLRAIVMFVLLGLALGCGGSGRGPLGQVEGTVTLEGKPINEGTIIFEVAGARPATGTISSGKIVDVTTYEPNDGVPVGEASVAIFATGTAPAPAETTTPANPDEASQLGKNYMGGNAQSLIPKKYNNPATSELNCTIESGKNEVSFDLKK